MSSKFAQGDGCLFSTREAAIEFLDNMLIHKFFHRAKKIPVSEQELKGRTKKEKPVSTEKDRKKDVKKEVLKEDRGTEDAESSHVEGREEKPVINNSMIHI